MLINTKHVILLILFHSSLSQNEILSNIKELKKPLKFFTNFLDKFRNYHVVFHADPLTIRFVDKMLIYVKNFESTYNIYNHETYNEIFVRPNVSRVLNVLLSESDEFFAKINSYEIVKYTDVVVFVFWEASSFEFVKNTRDILRLAGNMLAVHLTEKLQTVFRACYYCGTKSGKYQRIYATNTSKFHLNPEAEKLLQLDDFKNLQQHKLNAMFTQYYPFVYCPLARGNICPNLGGIEGYFIQTMSEKLNFSYTVNTLESGTFFNMIQNIHKQKYDFAFGGISITKDRMPLIQYTMQYNNEDYVFLYLLKLRFREIFHKFVEPFRSYVVWTLYIFCYVLFCVILHAYNLIHKTFRNLGFVHISWVGVCNSQ